uniref:(northern house mosquito) hypothetical protein n=1 Tax=Culex pipiens TaxID=7175 RepID=A0A8D8NT39_CULPI
MWAINFSGQDLSSEDSFRNGSSRLQCFDAKQVAACFVARQSCRVVPGHFSAGVPHELLLDSLDTVNPVLMIRRPDYGRIFQMGPDQGKVQRPKAERVIEFTRHSEQKPELSISLVDYC